MYVLALYNQWMIHLLISIIVIVTVGLLLILINLSMKRKGYNIPGICVVRCSKEHVFKTRWIEGVSLKAVRLGPYTRYQYCPVGKHLAIVHPVKRQQLTAKERRYLARETER